MTGRLRSEVLSLLGIVVLIASCLGGRIDEPAQAREPSQPGDDGPPTPVGPTDEPEETAGEAPQWEGPGISRPVAVCAPSLYSSVTAPAVFDGSGSYDPQDLSMTYQWTLSRPTGSSASFSDSTTANPVLTPDVIGRYSAELEVRNSEGVLGFSCSQSAHIHAPIELWIEATWQDPDDYDLHLLQANDGTADPYDTPTGTFNTDTDCNIANCWGTWSGPDWGVPGVTTDNPWLVLDDIQGRGPEVITIERPADGVYSGCYEIILFDHEGRVDNYPPNPFTVDVYVRENLAASLAFTTDVAGGAVAYSVAKVQWPEGLVIPCNGAAGCTPGCP